MRSSSKRSLPTEHSCPALATPAPNPLTGVPNKDLPPVPGRPRPQPAQTSPKRAPFGPLIPRPQPTGVPDKDYRGAQQGLPGSPTNTTGVPDKWLLLKLLQNGDFRVVFFGPFVFVSLVVLCC